MGIVMKVLNRQYHRNQDRDQGFTLIELVITIAIIAIIAAMAAPSMQKQIQQAKTNDAANIIEAALKNAKSQALITQKNIKVVLTDTSTNKNLKLFYVGDDTTKTVPLATYTLDKNISIITDASNLTAVSFTPYKNAYPGDTGTRPDNTDTDSSTNFSVCYGAGSDKYTIMVDASSNIVTSKMGRVHEFTKRHWLNRSAGSIDVVSNRGAWIHCDADDRS
jgi:prepilin-type N-terminal cleavage/methylation domain-containing protein